MDRNREARRGVSMAASNGLSRRRHRSSSLRDSPDEDGPLELQETARLRDRKKDRDRDRDRERDRDRDRERERDRERDRLSRSSKRRRSDKFMHGTNREDGGDDSSDDSMNDDDEDEDDDGGAAGNSSSMRMLPPNPPSSSSSLLNHHHHHNSSNNSNNHHSSNHSRKSFPPQPKVFRASPTVAASAAWKAADEMIGVSVPRKARSASTKRSHECWSSSAAVLGGGESIHRQASTSPVRPSIAAVLATPAPPPASPSSSNASVRKKMKPSGPKPRPPKSSSNKSSSSAQEEIEIEIAEVLYGLMRQPQGPSKQEIIVADSNSRETNNNNINNKSASDAKSRVSSPISNSPSTLPQTSSILPTNSGSSNAPMSAIAPKRKKPRPVKYEDENSSAFTVRNSPISSTPKAEMDQSVKTDTCSPILEKTGSAAAENGSVSYDLMSSEPSEQQPQPDTLKPERNAAPLTDSKCAPVESESGGGDVGVTKEEPQSPKKESTVGLRLDDDRRENSTLTKANSTTSEIENQREEKFQIDLMAPPPQRSSPERDDFVRVDLQPEMKPGVKDDAIAVKTVKEDASVEAEVKKVKTTVEESESQKPVVNKERNVDLQLDLEKTDKDSGIGSLTGNKMNQHVQKQHHQPPPPVPEKTGQSNSLPLPLPMAGWPGGLPPMGYMAPLQGVVSVDGSAVSPAAIQPPHLLFSQPRPKRCATHFYIARNIHFHQQFTRMNQFWPPPPGSASIYGAKTSNLNIVPPTEMHGSIPVRGVNSVQDKGQGLAIFPGHTGKDNKGSQPAAVVDAAQRKQILLQQALPPGAPNNILHAPAFIFPLSQQQAAAAASVRPGSVKSPPATGSSASSNASNSASVSANAPVGASAAALGFNYPNIPGNETQYLAILQNNAYPFPISHVGAPPAYRGAHPQAMPFFNSSFYSSQMLHPSQLQQQQQQQQQQPLPLPTQSQQSQGHPNPSVSSGSSSSQKHLQNQQQRPHNNGINGGSGTLQGFPAPKNQPQQLHGQRQQQNQQVPHQARQLETDMVGEESPSTADSRVSRANMNIYNLAMPLHPPNFPLMTSASMGGATSASGSHGEKKSQQQQPPQLQGSKAGVETLNPQTFAMSFAISGAPAPGQDISSIAQNPAILQSLPEAMRHGYQIMAAAAQAAQQKKNYRGVEEGKSGSNDASNVEEERKSMAGKPPATVGQSIAFNRPDLTDTPASTMMGNAVIDSSARTLNIGFMPPRTSVMPPSIGSVNPSTAPQQMQWNQQQQQQQIIQLHKQQQFAAGGRSKTPATSNGNAYTDHLPSSSMAAKFPNALSSFPQNLVQSGGNPAQSHQWKNSGRTSTAQVTSPSLSSTTSSVKNLPQQQGRTQQNHNQISFAAKSSSAAQGQQPPSNNQSPPPMVVGSPTTSSISKTSTGGSPRTTTATSTGNKSGQASSLSSQQAKNSASIPSRKSSPVTSILGNPTITSSSTVAKPQTPQLQQQQQLFQKQAMQQAQLLFSNAAYMQAQAQHVGSTTSSATPASGFFIQRHRDQQQPQKHQGASASSSSGMLSLCPPVTHSNTGTSDPAQAVAAAASNMKGGGLTSQGLIHSVQFATAQSSGKPHQLVPAGFQYVHPVPAAVQVKPSEQKQPAGE